MARSNAEQAQAAGYTADQYGTYTKDGQTWANNDEGSQYDAEKQSRDAAQVLANRAAIMGISVDQLNSQYGNQSTTAQTYLDPVIGAGNSSFSGMDFTAAQAAGRTPAPAPASPTAGATQNPYANVTKPATLDTTTKPLNLGTSAGGTLPGFTVGGGSATGPATNTSAGGTGVSGTGASTAGSGYFGLNLNQQVNAGTSTVEGRLGNLLATDANGNYTNDVVRQATDRAKQSFAQRGLLNTSMAVQAGQEAAIAKGIEIATPDAQTYYQQARANQDAQNEQAWRVQQQAFANETMDRQAEAAASTAESEQNNLLRQNYLAAVDRISTNYQQAVSGINTSNMSPADKTVAISQAASVRDGEMAYTNNLYTHQPGWKNDWLATATNTSGIDITRVNDTNVLQNIINDPAQTEAARQQARDRLNVLNDDGSDGNGNYNSYNYTNENLLNGGASTGNRIQDYMNATGRKSPFNGGSWDEFNKWDAARATAAGAANTGVGLSGGGGS